MTKVKLDKIDRKILNDLQENGRMTNVELAERAGISAPPCLRRVRALEDAGIIKGYHAKLNSNALGYGIAVYAQIGLNRQSENDLKSFEMLCQEWDQVRECHLVSGEFDFFLKIVAKDWDAYQRFLTEHLTAVPNIGHIKSSLGIRSTKLKPGVPIQID